MKSIYTLTALAGLTAMPISASVLEPRQVPCTDIGRLFTQVNTALFAVNYMFQSFHPCDPGLIPFIDERGYLGAYAMDLICLLDAESQLDPGFDRRVFNESLPVVNDNFIVTLIGLFDAAAGVTDPSRNVSCSKLDVDILNEAELPGSLIQSIICDTSICSPPRASSSSSPTSQLVNSTIGSASSGASIASSSGSTGSGISSASSVSGSAVVGSTSSSTTSGATVSSMGSISGSTVVGSTLSSITSGAAVSSTSSISSSAVVSSASGSITSGASAGSSVVSSAFNSAKTPPSYTYYG